jgi:AcrR family transcriptional regulator
MSELTATAPALLPPVDGLTSARRRLYEAALILLGSRDYDSVSVRDITDALGQHPTAIYAHVASKQDLLYRLMRIGHELLRDRLRAAVLGADSNPTSQVEALVRSHVLTHLEFPALARMLNRNRAHLTEEQSELINLLISDCRQMLSDVVDRGIHQGEFNPIDTELAITTISAIGVASAEWWTPDRGAPEHIADVYATYALRMLR